MAQNSMNHAGEISGNQMEVQGAAMPLSATTTDSLTPVYPLKISPDAEEWLKTLAPGTFEDYHQIELLWNRPTVQFAITLAHDDQFSQALGEMRKKESVGALMGWEIAWVVLIWVFRAWRLSKVETVFLKIWTQLWVSVIFWVGFFVLVPYLAYGQAYVTVMSHLFRAFLKHFLV
jgi:hypothetical protein